MANLAEWIEQTAGEEIEAVVIGEMEWGDYGSDAIPDYAAHPRGKSIPWEEAKTYLGYEFDDGYGAPGCEAIYAWSKSWVIFIVQYDGSTGTHRVPRHPVDIMPEMPGG